MLIKKYSNEAWFPKKERAFYLTFPSSILYFITSIIVKLELNLLLIDF